MTIVPDIFSSLSDFGKYMQEIFFTVPLGHRLDIV